MLNRIIVTGRIAEGPFFDDREEVISMVRFTLAFPRPGADKPGEVCADPMEVVAWGQTAQFIAQYIGPYRTVCVEGRLRVNRWTAASGRKGTDFQIIASRVYPVDKKPETPRLDPNYYGGVDMEAVFGDEL